MAHGELLRPLDWGHDMQVHPSEYQSRPYIDRQHSRTRYWLGGNKWE